MATSGPLTGAIGLPITEIPRIVQYLHTWKEEKGLTFGDIAQKIGRNEVWVAAVFLGQAKPTAEEDGIAAMERWWPNRGIGPAVPTDPVVYRLYEGVLVYGQPIKAIIHEKFGDGIMSMIDCKIDVQRKEDPKGDRVLLTFDGKFLPYAHW